MEKEKDDKYQACLNELRTKYGFEEGVILPVVLGGRGTITAKTKEILYELG